MFFVTSVVIGLIILTWFWCSPEGWFAELALSFLPYIMVLLGIVCVLMVLRTYGLIFFPRGKKKYRLLFVIAILRSGILWGFMLSKFLKVYKNPVASFSPQEIIGVVDNVLAWPEDKETLTVYYANIFYQNYNFFAIQQEIQALDPDIVALVEYSDEHTVLNSFFKERYPYVNATSRSNIHAGNVIFSKYPVENLMDKYPIEVGKWRYNYLKINANIPLYFYLVHTSAPVSFENFNMRNDQLQRLSQDFLTQAADRKAEDNVLMVGDFNVSPRSTYYTQFTQSLSPWVHNAFTGRSPAFTRCMEKWNKICSHIDHLFLSEELELTNLETRKLNGSDHKALWFTVQK